MRDAVCLHKLGVFATDDPAVAAGPRSLPGENAPTHPQHATCGHILRALRAASVEALRFPAATQELLRLPGTRGPGLPGLPDSGDQRVPECQRQPLQSHYARPW